VAASPEHRYLAGAVTEILSALADSRLYGYSEAERGRLDFSCILAETWKHLIAGQVLWKHEAFVDRDLRSLLATDEPRLAVYVARHTSKTQAVLREAVADYRKGRLAAAVPRLKVFWIAPDFDADDESSRSIVRDQLRADIANDVLLNVVLGRLNGSDARRLARGGSLPLLGLEVAALAMLATGEFISVKSLAQRLEVSASTTKLRLERLMGTRLLDEKGHTYTVTTAGRAMLRICAELFACDVTSAERLAVGAELSYILGLLEDQPVYEGRSDTARRPRRDIALRDLLWLLAGEASRRWGINWSDFRLAAGVRSGGSVLGFGRT
jgi:hypothetical protein